MGPDICRGSKPPTKGTSDDVEVDGCGLSEIDSWLNDPRTFCSESKGSGPSPGRLQFGSEGFGGNLGGILGAKSIRYRIYKSFVGGVGLLIIGTNLVL